MLSHVLFPFKAFYPPISIFIVIPYNPCIKPFSSTQISAIKLLTIISMVLPMMSFLDYVILLKIGKKEKSTILLPAETNIMSSSSSSWTMLSSGSSEAHQFRPTWRLSN